MTTAVFLSLPASMTRIVDGRDFGDVIRQEVIDRWALCVDKVISVNWPPEAKALIPLVSRVEIIEVEGQLQVPISAIAKIAAIRGYSKIAISNSDCIPIDVKLTKELVLSTSTNAALFLRRSNISTTTKQASNQVFHGIDTFILGNEAIKAIPTNSDWKIGQPVWDTWLPLLLLSKGVNTSGIKAYLFAHFDHPQKWNDVQWLSNARKLLHELSPMAIKSDLQFPLAAQPYVSTWSDQQVRAVFDEFAELLFYLERQPAQIDSQFGSLWLSVLKSHFGPDDSQFTAYVNARGHSLRRWLIKNGLLRTK